MSQQELTKPSCNELFLDGDLVLRHIASLKVELQAALAESDQLLLDLSAAGTVDLAFLQLLCSAHRSAVQSNKSFALAGKLPEDFQRKLKEAGFARHVGCGRDDQRSCLWMGRDD